MNNTMHEKSDLLIIGGGIFGASIAYYYKRDNPDNEVIVIERNEFCSANTSLAAGLMSRVRSDGHIIPFSKETYRVIPELELLSNSPIPIYYQGAIHLAVQKLENKLKVASGYGIEWEYISSVEASKHVPWLKAKMANSIVYIKNEAFTDPYLFCMGFINAAKSLGVKFYKNMELIEMIKDGRNIIGARTERKDYYAEKTVLAAGVWSSVLARQAGIILPMAPVLSHYWITEPSTTLFYPNSPIVIIPEAKFYARPLGKSLLFGLREAESTYEDPRKLPKRMEDYKFSNDNGWYDLEENYKKFIPFFPEFENVGIKNYIAGFSAYTPDNGFILGEVSDVKGLLIATGCVGAGISVAGGVGLGISRKLVNNENPFDFNFCMPERFGNFDPYSTWHLKRCASARSLKLCG